VEYPALRDLAVAAARAAGDAALPHFRDRGLAVETKGDDSPVTVADRAAEAAARSAVREIRPDDGWLGEETGAEAGTSGLTWIVDPIDGTRNFVRGIPLWTSLVACEDAGRGVLAAAVAAPALGECYEAFLGGGARCDGHELRVSAVDSLDAALWCFESPYWFRAHGLAPLFEDLCAATGLQRGIGDAYSHMLVASGRAEVAIEPSLHVWDLAAPSLIVREAGGAFTDLDGAATIRAGNAVVTNGRLHEEILKRIAAGRVPSDGAAS